LYKGFNAYLIGTPTTSITVGKNPLCRQLHYLVEISSG
jgi:hypothetical protein